MPKIVRCQLSEVVSDIASIEVLDPHRLGDGSPEDLFLCALGFEPRCLELPGRLKDGGYKAKRAAYLKYGTNLDDNAVNLPQLESHLREISSNPEPVESDAPDFSRRLRTVLDLVVSEASDTPPRVTFDISVSANRLLLRCMRILLEYDISLRIVYSEAAVYHPTAEEYEKTPSNWEQDGQLGLERGVGDVTPSSDYPGHGLDPLPDFLVLFPNFKAERSHAVISFVDPSLLADPSEKVVWILGVPHLDQDRWRLEAMKLINGISKTASQYEVSTFDYKDTLRVLENINGAKSDRHRITISPLGSKMQALGTALFCYMHPGVRIIFSIPKEYNAVQYSKGCREVWQIHLGPLSEIRQALDRVATLRIEEQPMIS